MLSLTKQDILLSQSAQDKTQAIRAIGKQLTNKGFVESGYVDGLLAREAQSSTFLGNGIAIPHGTTDTRSLVQQTGVSVHHFPQGVDWGNGTVYVAIGIAAKSDEHLGILKQLTQVLSADGVEQALKSAQTEDEIIGLLMGETQLAPLFDESLVSTQFPAKDMLQLCAVGSGLIRNQGAANEQFISQILTKTPQHLGDGIWLVAGEQGVNKTAISFVSTQNVLEQSGLPLNALITLACCNQAHLGFINTLTELSYAKKLTSLVEADPHQLMHLFGLTDEAPSLDQDEAANQAIFKIKNSHGLHARPGAMLVASAKKYDASIRVRNLDGDQKFVNAKSLMKVIAMGVKHGHRLEFVADGEDANVALEGIGQAIESGLGEG